MVPSKVGTILERVIDNQYFHAEYRKLSSNANKNGILIDSGYII